MDVMKTFDTKRNLEKHPKLSISSIVEYVQRGWSRLHLGCPVARVLLSITHSLGPLNANFAENVYRVKRRFAHYQGDYEANSDSCLLS